MTTGRHTGFNHTREFLQTLGTPLKDKPLEQAKMNLFIESIKNGTNKDALNSKDKNGCPALMLAIKHNPSIAMELLAIDGIDVNCTNNTGDTPLHQAVESRNNDYRSTKKNDV